MAIEYSRYELTLQNRRDTMKVFADFSLQRINHCTQSERTHRE